MNEVSIIINGVRYDAVDVGCDKKCAENFGIDYLDVEDFLQTIFKEETK
jgi:hypothetical protein